MDDGRCVGDDVVDDPDVFFFSIHTTTHDALKHPFQVFQQSSSRPQILRILGGLAKLVTLGADPGFHFGVSGSLSSRLGNRGPGSEMVSCCCSWLGRVGCRKFSSL